MFAALSFTRRVAIKQFKPHAVCRQVRVLSTEADFERVVFFGRTMKEYEAMFDVNFEKLQNTKLLDCPGGPSSFQAEARKKYNISTISVDPMYAHSRAELEAMGKKDIDSTLKKMFASPEKYPTTKDLAYYQKYRYQGLNDFLNDFEVGKPEGRYMNVSLPKLPFADNQFDNTNSGYLLFCYSSIATGGLMHDETFDLQWHQDSIKELLRVTKKEIRLFPVHSHTPYDDKVIHPFAKIIIDELRATNPNVECNFFQSKYVGMGLRISKK